MIEPYTRVFAKLVDEYGYEMRYQSANGPHQYVEQVAKRHLYRDALVDSVTFSCSKDRSDIYRGATLIGWGENRRFGMNELLNALGFDPTGTDDDFLTAATQLDVDTVERLAPS